MALWQYSFQLLTKESFDLLNNDGTIHFNKEGFDSDPYWQIIQINRCFFDKIETILKKSSSWSSVIDLYGEQESNCFEILIDPITNLVTSASFRIDITSNYDLILSRIIEFCILNNLLILDEYLMVVPLNSESIKTIIETSPQVRKFNYLSNKNTR